MKPTQEQEREFWEWCGFKLDIDEGEYPYGSRVKWIHPDGEWDTELPPIDLNNLFKYAVPKLRNLSEDNTLQDIEFHWQGSNISDVVECNLIFDEAQFDGEAEDPALALFWALDKVREASK